eukprot:Skav226494  [mRNA]  locus=scaffold4305:6360:16879:+ [translate_table: standard]
MEAFAQMKVLDSNAVPHNGDSEDSSDTEDASSDSHDQRLADKILKKRRDEMARRMRLLDPRQRVGGVPHEVIKTQMAVKQSAVDDQILQAVESMKATRARERQMEVVDYSLANLRKHYRHCGSLSQEQRREYELSDPDALKKYVVPDPDDPANPLGPSSMLKWSPRRHALLPIKQDRAQVQEKQDRLGYEKEVDHSDAQAEAMLSAHVRAVCEDTEMQEPHEATIADVLMPRHPAFEMRFQERWKERAVSRMKKLAQAKKEADDAWKQRHIETVMNSERMMESCDSKIGLTGRLLKAEYKRLSLEQEQAWLHFFRCMELLRTAELANCQERRMRIIEENKKLAAAKRDADKLEREEYFKYDP